MKLRKLLLNIIFAIMLIKGCNTKTINKRGVMDNFNDGIKYAGQMFGINTAADVANLVAKAFSTNASNNSNRGKPDLFSIIQKGLQASLATTSPSPPTSEETQQNYESEESRGHQGNSEDSSSSSTGQYKPLRTKTTATPDNENFGLNLSTSNLVTSMLRMVGFDASKLGALAINALIMIASAIGNTILGATNSKPNQRQHTHPDHDDAETGPEENYGPTDQQPRQLKDGSPLDWFLQNPSTNMKGLLDNALDSNLSEKITNMIENYETTEGQGGCLKMLMCKSSPFIWGMQKAVKKRIEGGASKEAVDKEKSEETTENPENKRLFNADVLFTDLPTLSEFREHSAKCEKRFSSYCNTTDFYRRKKRQEL